MNDINSFDRIISDLFGTRELHKDIKKLQKLKKEKEALTEELDSRISDGGLYRKQSIIKAKVYEKLSGAINDRELNIDELHSLTTTLHILKDID